MLGIGLYGENGHQVQSLLENHPEAELIGVSHFARPPAQAKTYATLEEMLDDPRVRLVSLCSPNRADQAEQAIACMRAGKHVYAEKPCALCEEDLSRIMETAAATGMVFHEMAGTAFAEPYVSMGEIVRSGQLGNIVQVFVQKSYPYHADRPQDEAVDGGLFLQVGIHALRLIEHAAHARIRSISAVETGYGNPVAGGALRMAAGMSLTLEGGAIATVIANYLNQHGHGAWGNDHLRIFGEKGFVESTDGGTRTRLVVGGADLGAVPVRKHRVSYFDRLVRSILHGEPMPLSMEEELHPLKMALCATRMRLFP